MLTEESKLLVHGDFETGRHLSTCSTGLNSQLRYAAIVMIEPAIAADPSWFQSP